MIQGIQGYNNTKGANLGEEKPKLAPGNYLCKILAVKVIQNKKGEPMFVLQFDIADGEFAGHYINLFNNAQKQDANAKYKGLYYQNMTGNGLQFYKGLLESLEKSNNIKLDGENGFDESILKGKLFIGRFGEEEYEKQDGTIGSFVKLRYITDTTKKDLPILNKKTITPKNTNNETFYSIEQGVDDDSLPF